jgi:hypothetical protein
MRKRRSNAKGGNSFLHTAFDEAETKETGMTGIARIIKTESQNL